MTTQSQAPPHELVPAEPTPRAGATAVVLVPATPATDPVETVTVEQRVQTVAGLAARAVAGVHALGAGNGSDGVTVATGERQTAIGISLVLDYGASVTAVSRAVRRKVIRAVEQDTGLEVTAVDVDVTDVHLPGARPVGSLGGWPE